METMDIVVRNGGATNYLFNVTYGEKIGNEELALMNLLASRLTDEGNCEITLTLEDKISIMREHLHVTELYARAKLRNGLKYVVEKRRKLSSADRPQLKLIKEWVASHQDVSTAYIQYDLDVNGVQVRSLDDEPEEDDIGKTSSIYIVLLFYVANFFSVNRYASKIKEEFEVVQPIPE